MKQTDKGTEIKLADFCCATFIKTEDEYMTKSCGSKYYIAPEVLNEKYQKSSDIWSVGVLTFCFLTGRFPFYDKDDEKLKFKIKIQ